MFAIVLVPVALGMLVRNRATAFAERMDKPVCILSAAVLALVIVGTIVAERENVAGYIRDVGLPALLFCLASLAAGFFVPRALGVVPGRRLQRDHVPGGRALRVGDHRSARRDAPAEAPAA